MKDNNKGFSLVELIVVIALMAVLVGFVVLSMGVLGSSQARECAQKVSGKIDSVKTGSLSLYDETMELKFRTKAETGITSDGYYTSCYVYTIDHEANNFASTEPETRKVGSKNVIIKVYFSDATSLELGKTNSITVSFDRSSGAFDYAMVNGSIRTDASGNPVHYDKITFTNGSKVYTLKMVPETGKHYVE